VFEGAGADVVAIGCEPDGQHQRRVRSTATELLSGASSSTAPTSGWPSTATPTACWRRRDRRTGRRDSLLALFARDLADRGQLAGNTVV